MHVAPPIWSMEMSNSPAPRTVRGDSGSRLSSFGTRTVHRVDLFQRRHPFLGLPWSVLRKYTDDDGPRLAALMTYYGFLSLFPLLLLATTAVTELLRWDPELQRQMLDHLVNPKWQPDIEQALAQLPPSGIPLAVGIVSLLFAGTGGVLATYSALNRMWGVPWRDRFGLVQRYARAALMLVVSLVGAVIAAGSAVVADNVLRLAPIERGIAAAATGTAVFAMVGTAHKVLVCRPLRMRDIWLGALIGAIAVTVLLNAAAIILPTLVSRAGVVYGSFATVVGTFALLYLINQTLVLSVELSTVIESGLSPRGLTNASLTDGDRSALVLLARRQERIAGQRTTTTLPSDPGDQ
jgi:membrane protein